MNDKFLCVAFLCVLIMSCTNAQKYHEDDKEGLRAFLRQPSIMDGKLNVEQTGLTIGDTLDWQNSESWVQKIEGLVWNDKSPKRLTEIEWTFRYLGGNLDARLWRDLTVLDCLSNELTAINVRSNKMLTALQCTDNQLTALDVSKNTALRQLVCGNNKLTALDLHANKALIMLWCEDNQINTLDLRANGALIEVQCSYNQLTSLSLGANTVLTNLSCNWNKLATLDVRANNALTVLGCSFNKLDELDVCANTNLELLHCCNNRLPISSLFAISKSKTIKELIVGTQNLNPQKVNIGQVLFSDQSVFGGIYTDHEVFKKDILAPEHDYTVTDGKIKFNSSGNYTVTMTNKALDASGLEGVARVSAEIEVVEE